MGYYVRYILSFDQPLTEAQIRLIKQWLVDILFNQEGNYETTLDVIEKEGWIEVIKDSQVTTFTVDEIKYGSPVSDLKAELYSLLLKLDDSRLSGAFIWENPEELEHFEKEKAEREENNRKRREAGLWVEEEPAQSEDPMERGWDEIGFEGLELMTKQTEIDVDGKKYAVQHFERLAEVD
jgi:hypothetical protein